MTSTTCYLSWLGVFTHSSLSPTVLAGWLSDIKGYTLGEGKNVSVYLSPSLIFIDLYHLHIFHWLYLSTLRNTPLLLFSSLRTVLSKWCNVCHNIQERHSLYFTSISLEQYISSVLKNASDLQDQTEVETPLQILLCRWLCDATVFTCPGVTCMCRLHTRSGCLALAVINLKILGLALSQDKFEQDQWFIAFSRTFGQ